MKTLPKEVLEKIEGALDRMEYGQIILDINANSPVVGVTISESFRVEKEELPRAGAIVTRPGVRRNG